MANRVLVGNRSTGGYGIYISRPVTTGSGNDVLDCANDKLMFNTNSGESGSNFFSAGHFQVVPVSGGTGNTPPVTSATNTIQPSATASPSYVNIASTQVLLWGSSPSTVGAGGGENISDIYSYTSLGSTSATLTNHGTSERTIRSVAFNMLSTLALF